MASKTNAKGRRYTPQEKREILEFITQYNSQHGRGGATAAMKKFGISQPTLSLWINNSGGDGDPGGTPPHGSGAKTKLLHQLVEIDRQMARKRAELESLEMQFSKLKSQL
jgi:transposase-like protein